MMHGAWTLSPVRFVLNRAAEVMMGVSDYLATLDMKEKEKGCCRHGVGFLLVTMWRRYHIAICVAHYCECVGWGRVRGNARA